MSMNNMPEGFEVVVTVRLGAQAAMEWHAAQDRLRVRATSDLGLCRSGAGLNRNDCFGRSKECQ